MFCSEDCLHNNDAGTSCVRSHATYVMMALYLALALVCLCVAVKKGASIVTLRTFSKTDTLSVTEMLVFAWAASLSAYETSFAVFVVELEDVSRMELQKRFYNYSLPISIFFGILAHLYLLLSLYFIAGKAAKFERADPKAVRRQAFALAVVAGLIISFIIAPLSVYRYYTLCVVIFSLWILVVWAAFSKTVHRLKEAISPTGSDAPLQTVLTVQRASLATYRASIVFFSATIVYIICFYYGAWKQDSRYRGKATAATSFVMQLMVTVVVVVFDDVTANARSRKMRTSDMSANTRWSWNSKTSDNTAMQHALEANVRALNQTRTAHPSASIV